MKKAKIEVYVVMNGTTQIFLNPTCDMGRLILDSISNPIIKPVSANYQLGSKSLANAFLIEEGGENE